MEKYRLDNFKKPKAQKLDQIMAWKPTYSDAKHEYKPAQIASLGSSPKHSWKSNPHPQKVSQRPLLRIF